MIRAIVCSRKDSGVNIEVREHKTEFPNSVSLHEFSNYCMITINFWMVQMIVYSKKIVNSVERFDRYPLSEACFKIGKSFGNRSNLSTFQTQSSLFSK
jgi:hypothetical protein